MNINDLEVDFVALLRKVHDAKQDRDDKYAPMREAFNDSDQDLYITENKLDELGFGGESFWEVVCPALVKSGVLESYEKYVVNEEKNVVNYPYHFRVSEERLFEGSGRTEVDLSNLSYSDKERIFNVNGNPVVIVGNTQHAVLSIIFSYFRDQLFGEGVDLIDIAKEDDNLVEAKFGVKKVDNALRQINSKIREKGFANLFDLTEKKVRLHRG